MNKFLSERKSKIIDKTFKLSCLGALWLCYFLQNLIKFN